MKTSKRHFRLFCRECQRLKALWRLAGWRLYFLHNRIPPEDHDAAQIVVDLDGRCATLILGTDWAEDRPTDGEIIRSAQHEMVHLLVQPLGAMGQQRWTTREAYRMAEHEVVQRLQLLLCGGTEV